MNTHMHMLYNWWTNGSNSMEHGFIHYPADGVMKDWPDILPLLLGQWALENWIICLSAGFNGILWKCGEEREGNIYPLLDYSHKIARAD